MAKFSRIIRKRQKTTLKKSDMVVGNNPHQTISV
jgi:ElaB/YqjD/DUF883 family membrane-anchored ribosome-binding protein